MNEQHGLSQGCRDRPWVQRGELGYGCFSSGLVRLESCGQAVQRFVCTGHVPGNLPMQRLQTCTCTGGDEEKAFDGESDAILFMVSVQMLRNKACDTSNSTVRTRLAPHASNDMGVVVQVPDREDKRELLTGALRR